MQGKLWKYLDGKICIISYFIHTFTLRMSIHIMSCTHVWMWESRAVCSTLIHPPVPAGAVPSLFSFYCDKNSHECKNKSFPDVSRPPWESRYMVQNMAFWWIHKPQSGKAHGHHEACTLSLFQEHVFSMLQTSTREVLYAQSSLIFLVHYYSV